jgi:hypothetical protein
MVNEMLRRCHQGPRAAVVDAVEVLEEEGGVAPSGFNMLPTA